MMDFRPRAPAVDTSDIFVDQGGLIYITDMNAGLYVFEMDRP